MSMLALRSGQMLSLETEESFDDECARCGDPLPFAVRGNPAGVCEMCIAKERLRPESGEILIEGHIPF
jgi:hypothetical protein